MGHRGSSMAYSCSAAARISSFGVLAPLIKSDLNLTSTQVGLFSSAIFIGASLCQIPVGLITDLVGVRRVLSLGIGLMGFFLVIFSFAPSFTWSFLLLLLFGFAAGVIPATANKCILDWFPVIGGGQLMGQKQTGANAGGILAGFLFPLMLLALSWRESFFLVGSVEMACAVMIYKLIRESPVKNQESKFSWRKILKVVLHRNIIILGAVNFCFMASQFCFNGYLTLFLVKELDYSVTRAGYYFAICYLVGAPARMFWSILSDYCLGGEEKVSFFSWPPSCCYRLLLLAWYLFTPRRRVLSFSSFWLLA